MKKRSGGPPRRSSSKTDLSRRSLVSLLGLGTVTVFGINSYSFTTGTVERQNSVGISNDQNALIGLTISTSVTRGDSNQTLYTITNNTQEPLSISTQINSPADTVATFSSTNTTSNSFNIASSETQTIQINVQADSQSVSSIPFSISVESTNSSFSATVSRDQTQLTGSGNRPPADDVYSIESRGNREVLFQILQGGNPQWSYGDGTTTNAYYQVYQYDSTGTYTVSLTVTIDGTQYTYTEEVEINEFASGPKPPVEDVILISNPNYTGPNTRIIQVGRGYDPQWTFGDGGSSTNFYNNYTYDSPGTYTVTLEITIDGSRYQYQTTVTI